MGTFRIGKVVLRSLFKKPATLMYPVVPRAWQELTRGSIGIDEASCILCGICAKKCPTNAIAVSRTERIWAIERMQCIQCGNCVDTCPKKCLLMLPEYTAPDTVKILDSVSVPEQPKAAE
jgi:formate hydrogenlyase subunit 6/NADH:ubiquinone oxidoreductase subunit I